MKIQDFLYSCSMVSTLAPEVPHMEGGTMGGFLLYIS